MRRAAAPFTSDFIGGPRDRERERERERGREMLLPMQHVLEARFIVFQVRCARQV